MKYILITLLSIVWLLTTVLLAITVIGVIAFMVEDENEQSYWFTYGKKLLNQLIS
jgi:hypothetical protein